MPRTWLLAFLFTLSVSAVALGPAVVAIDPTDKSIAMGRYAEVAAIPEGDSERLFGGVAGLLLKMEEQDLPEAVSTLLDHGNLQWRENERDMLVLQSESRLSLVRLRFQYRGDRTERFVLDLTGVHGIGWELTGGGSSHLDDFSLTLAGRPMVDINALIPMTLVPDQHYDLNIIAYTVQPAGVAQLNLSTGQAYYAKRIRDYLIDGLFHGVAAALALVTLFLSIFLRRLSFLYFSLFIMASSAVMFTSAGLAAVIWPHLLLSQLMPATYLAVGLVGLFGTLFSMKLLDINAREPWMARIWFAVAIGYGVSTPVIVYLTRWGGIDYSGFLGAMTIAAVIGISAQLVYAATGINSGAKASCQDSGYSPLRHTRSCC